MGGFSLTHLLIVAVIGLLFFGPNRLPALGQSLGKALRGFKEGLNEIEVDSKDITHQRLEKPRENAADAQSATAEKTAKKDSTDV